MKFYYEGQLMRTSKNHHYTHAIIKRTKDEIKCRGCSSSKEGAEKLMQELPVFRSYRMWLSVQNGSYKQKDRWCLTAEGMKERAIKEYGSVDEAVKLYKEAIEKYEIVKVEEA